MDIATVSVGNKSWIVPLHLIHKKAKDKVISAEGLTSVVEACHPRPLMEYLRPKQTYDRVLFDMFNKREKGKILMIDTTSISTIEFNVEKWMYWLQKSSIQFIDSKIG